METKPPLPPFTVETARQKVRMAEDAWNNRDPDRVVLVLRPGVLAHDHALVDVGSGTKQGS
jgi:hypothetical protein